MNRKLFAKSPNKSENVKLNIISSNDLDYLFLKSGQATVEEGSRERLDDPTVKNLEKIRNFNPIILKEDIDQLFIKVN